jgi:hypothetical protein
LAALTFPKIQLSLFFLASSIITENVTGVLSQFTWKSGKSFQKVKVFFSF